MVATHREHTEKSSDNCPVQGKKNVLPLMADKSLLTHAVHHSDLGLADIHFGES